MCMCIYTAGQKELLKMGLPTIRLIFTMIARNLLWTVEGEIFIEYTDNISVLICEFK